MSQDSVWPDGIVPYRFDVDLWFDTQVFFKDQRDNISLALQMIENGVPCIEFRKVNERYTGHHLIYTNMGDDTYAGNLCISYVGRQNPAGVGKGQIINLMPDCLNIGKILHETLHALGAAHEMMRWDRDRYVRILEQNIQKGAKKNFNITSTESVTDPYSTFGTPFDFESVMHNVVLRMATQRSLPNI